MWTGQPLRAQSEFHVDHVIPFSLWFNNDLWNLLPASRRVNSAKSDKLVARTTLAKSKDLIIHYWEAARREQAERFDIETRRSLIRSGADDAAGWQNAAFAGLVENVETIAIQRGIERWSA